MEGAGGAAVHVVGRYAIYDEIASGGMAVVHFGRLIGPVGFSRTVAIKRLHAQFARDPAFVSMFLDEARVVARIRHPNVVQTLDVVATTGDLFLVMEYVQGEPVSKLIRASRKCGERPPLRIVASIMCGVLAGLHAAHEARDEQGSPLNIVHRDISPHNILVGQDGIARVLDFGVAKAAGRAQNTREGQLKGKLAYMAPEQVSGTVSRRTDVFAASIVLWELLATRRLFSGDTEAALLAQVLTRPIPPPSSLSPEAAPMDAVVMRGLERDPANRWATAREMALALEQCVGLASPREVGEWVEAMAGQALLERARRVSAIESSSPSGELEAAPDTTTQPSGPPAIARTQVDPHDPPSQLSSISVTTPADPEPRRRAAYVMAMAAGLLVLTAAVVLFVTRHRESKTEEQPAKSTKSEMSETAPSAVVAGSATTATTAAIVVPAAASSAPAPSSKAPAPPHAAPRKTPATSVSTIPPADKSCNPPYVLDAVGHKKWKPECL